MKKKQNIVPLKDLNLTERFLFDEVMEDKETYQDVLGAIFGKEMYLRWMKRKASITQRCGTREWQIWQNGAGITSR